MQIAAGEIEKTIPEDGKDPAAKVLGNKGGAWRWPHYPKIRTYRGRVKTFRNAPGAVILR
jgi:hypothetical protein